MEYNEEEFDENIFSYLLEHPPPEVVIVPKDFFLEQDDILFNSIQQEVVLQPAEVVSGSFGKIYQLLSNVVSGFALGEPEKEDCVALELPEKVDSFSRIYQMKFVTIRKDEDIRPHPLIHALNPVAQDLFKQLLNNRGKESIMISGLPGSGKSTMIFCWIQKVAGAVHKDEPLV